jgi:hypothetical protein
LRRTAGRREPRESFAVYCEGRVTEKSYLLNLKRELRASNVFIQWVPGTPLDVVKRAERDGRSADAVVWCVFDAEAPRLHPNFEQALARAERNSFSCAVSNPCFELWALLHLADHSAYITTVGVCKALEAKLAGYSRRRKTIDYAALRPYLAAARERAIMLDNLHGDAKPVGERNPSTGVWRLVDALFTAAGRPL